MESKKFMDKRSVLIFGVGELQLSIIKRANQMGLFTVGIDPCEDAYSRSECCAFEVVGGQDYEGTLAVAKKYNIAAVVTAATDLKSLKFWIIFAAASLVSTSICKSI